MIAFSFIAVNKSHKLNIEDGFVFWFQFQIATAIVKVIYNTEEAVLSQAIKI